MNQSEDLIKLENVSRSFHTASENFPALENVNFKIKKGEYTAIVGRSGSGKSTLLNMLTGIDHPDEGAIVIDKMNIGSMDENALAKWRGENVGIVFQFFQLIPTLTIFENILLAMDFVGKIPRKERSERAEEFLEWVNISKHKNKLPYELSGGQQQRAAIARAMANDPEIIIADEPTGNLDVNTSEKITGLFENLSAKGKTVIMVTHEDISRMKFDRVIELKDGKVFKDSKKGGE